MNDNRTRWAGRLGPGLAPLLASLLVLAVLAACGSVRSDGAEASERTRHGLEESCGTSESFTPQSVLDGLAEEYTAPMYRPERDVLTTVRLRPVYDGGSIECNPGGADSSSRVAKMTMQIELGVETDDGTFRETIPVSLSGYVHSDEFRVSGAIDGAEIDGRYGRREDVQGGDTLLLEGWLSLESDRVDGALRAVGEGGTESGSATTVGVWDSGRYVATRPDRPCGEHGRLTRKTLLRRLQGPRDGALRLADRQEESDLRVRIEPGESPVVCEPPEANGGTARLTTDVQVEFQSDDDQFEESIAGSAELSETGELSWVASRPVRQLSGSFRPGERVPPGAKLIVRGSTSDEDTAMRGSLTLETPDGENPLGVPALGDWRARSLDRDRPMR